MGQFSFNTLPVDQLGTFYFYEVVNIITNPGVNQELSLNGH